VRRGLHTDIRGHLGELDNHQLGRVERSTDGLHNPEMAAALVCPRMERRGVGLGLGLD
jgi:hypothetical protein